MARHDCPNCQLFTECTSYCKAEKTGAADERAAVLKHLRRLAADGSITVQAMHNEADAIENGEHVK